MSRGVSYPSAYSSAYSSAYASTGISGVRQLLSLPTFGTDGKLVPGDWEDGRTSTIILPNEEGNYKGEIPTETLAYNNARYVINLINTISGAVSDDFESFWWSDNNVIYTTGVDDPDGGNNATTLTASGGTGYVLIHPSINNGTTGNFVNSIWIRRRTGTGNIFIYRPNDTAQIFTSVITSEWQRVATDVTVGKSATILRIGVIISTSGDAVDIYAPQSEDVSGKTNQSPGEYQLVNVSNSGIGIYSTENGNSVTSNIVTEATGSAISPAPVLAHHPATTNVFLNSNDPVTQTISVGTGDWTLSVHGSGTATSSANTATGTGYGAATDGSDNTFNITGAGTVDITIAGGPPDYVQLENKAFSTPPVLTTGSSASRTTCAISQAFSTAIFNQNSGFAYIDCTPDHAQSDLTTTDEGLLSVADSATNLLYIDSGNLQATDGTNTATVDPNYTADQKIRFFVYWDKVQDVLGVGYRTLPGGSFTWGTEQSYDDAFTSGSNLNLFYGGDHNWDIHDIGIYNKHKGQSYYEDNY